jgi:hypothetical protein
MRRLQGAWEKTMLWRESDLPDEPPARIPPGKKVVGGFVLSSLQSNVRSVLTGWLPAIGWRTGR